MIEITDKYCFVAARLDLSMDWQKKYPNYRLEIKTRSCTSWPTPGQVITT